MALMNYLDAKIIDPLLIRNKEGALEAYSDSRIIVSPHGSTMLNPLLLSASIIVGLFPGLLFSGYAHYNDLSQYSDVGLLFGSRIFPVYGEPVVAPCHQLDVNYSINAPHIYPVARLRERIEYAFSHSTLNHP
jgi:hypothetical protein